VDAIFANLEYWLAQAGGWAYLVAPLVMVAVSILPIPAEAPALANGMLFGPVVGTLISWSGAVVGAWISYEIARGWGRPFAAKFASEATVARLDGAAERTGWWGLLVLRLIPAFAFTAINWGAGLCGVPRARFLWTTAIGILPGAVLFTSSGAGLGVLWRRYPVTTTVCVAVTLVGTVLWMMRKRRPASEVSTS
jgi:uncharacterized membrane protein YdjX (TVP38/TMEM64 family)